MTENAERLALEKRSDAWSAWRDAKRRRLPPDVMEQAEREWRTRDREWQKFILDRLPLPAGDWES